MKTFITFLIMLAFFASCNNSAKKEINTPEVISKVEIGISGMFCTGCENTVTKGALAVGGVKEATASFTEGKAWISYDKGVVTPEQIVASIEKTGYKVTEFNLDTQPDSIQVQNN